MTVAAQAGDLQLTEIDFFAELPVVLHATRLTQPLAGTPASITILDQTLIQASTASTIPELLRFVAGFQVAYPSGSKATVTYHGVADQHSRNMQVSIDGRSVYSQIFGGIRWEQLAETTALQMLAYCESRVLWPPGFALDFSVGLNREVLRSLGLQAQSEDKLKKTLSGENR